MTIKDRILLHLFDFNRFADEYEAPAEVAQKGIAKAVGIRVRHVTQYVKPSISKGLINVRTGRVKDGARRQLVYFLTPSGRAYVASIRQALLQEQVPFRQRDSSLRAQPLRKIYQEERRGATLLSLVEEATSLGYVNETPPPDGGKPVDFSQEAPHVEFFYGREKDLEAVQRLVDQAPLVVVTGIAGIGKSALGSKALEAYRGSVSTFWHRVRPWDTTTDLALYLAGFLRALGKMELHSYLTGAGTKEIRRIEEIVTRDLVGTSCVLVLDDVHLAKEDAKDFFSILHEGLKQPNTGTALLLARTSPSFYSRRDVDVEKSVAELHLDGLSRESSRAFLVDRGFPTSQAEQLAKSCAGSPLFLRIVVETGPAGASDLGLSKLEVYISEEIEPSLEDEERDCLELASLYEVPVPPAGLLLMERGGIGTLIRLQKKGLLVKLGSGAFLVHDTIREYFQQGLPRMRRQDLVNRVVPFLVEEVERASNRGDSQNAIPLLENALLVETRPERRNSSLQTLGRLRMSIGDYVGAERALRMALEPAGGVTPRSLERATIRTALAWSLLWEGRFEDADREIATGLGNLPPGQSLEKAELLVAKGALAVRSNEFGQALEVTEQAMDVLSGLDEGSSTGASVGKARFSGIGLGLGRDYTRATVFTVRGQIFKGDPDRFDPARALSEFEASNQICFASDHKQLLGWNHFYMAVSALMLYRVNQALDYLNRSVEYAEDVGDPVLRVESVLLRARCLSECRGDYDGAEALYYDALTLHRQSGQSVQRPWLYRHLAELLWRQGRPEEASEEIEPFLVRDEESPPDSGAARDHSFMARLHVACGDPDTAVRYLDEAARLRASDPSRPATFFVEWARGAVRASQRRPREAESAFLAALEIAAFLDKDPMELKDLPVGGFRGEVLLDYGKFLLTTQSPSRAREVLLEASEELSAHRRAPLAQVARDEIGLLEVAVRHP